MKNAQYPPGWDEERVKRVLEYYESQADDLAVAEDEAAWEDLSETTMKIPVDLVPAVREMIRKRNTS